MIDIVLGVLVVVLLYLLATRQEPSPDKEHGDPTHKYLPYSIVEPHHPDFYNVELPLDVSDLEAKYVVYWAADGTNNSTRILPVELAYNEFANSGVALVDNKIAVLRFAYPQAYCVSNFARAKCSGGTESNTETLNPHVHYRIMSRDGTLSETRRIDLGRNLKEFQQLFAQEWSSLPPTNTVCA
jgi:hypothetical protein